MYKIVPVKVITPELMQEGKELAQKAGRLEDKIVSRIHYIMTSVFNTFGKKDAYWYFYGAPEGEQGDLWKHIYQDNISVVVDRCPGEDMVIVLKDGSEWSFEDSIPLHWLYEDFEEELTEGKKKYKELEAARKEAEKVKRQKAKEQTNELAKAAKAKLSKEELAALKRSL